MKKRWALLTIVASLALGITAAALFQGRLRGSMHAAFSCLLLDEAEKAGYLDKAKRSTLLDDLARTNSLDSSAREAVATLKAGCFSRP